MQTVLALDPSGRNTGLAVGVPGAVPMLASKRLATNPKTDDNVIVFGRAVKWFAEQLEMFAPEVVAIEQPLVLHNPMILCGLFGIFAGLAHARGARVMPTSILRWRRHFLGRGRLDGPTSKAEAVRICHALGWNPPDHDAAEAAGIWTYVCSCVAPGIAPRVEPLFTGAQHDRDSAAAHSASSRRGARAALR